MATVERGTVIQDIVEAQLVECVPPPEPDLTPVVVTVTDTPIAQMMDATIEHTGAGPPPKGAS